MTETIIPVSELLADRRKGLGGSDAHGYMSAGKFGCVRALVYEKLGYTPDRPFKGSAATERGNFLEDKAADFYAEKTGRRLFRRRVRKHKDYPFLIVHQDRAIVTCDDRGPGVLEIKCPGRDAFRSYFSDSNSSEGLPIGYQLQLQHGMMVTGYKWGSFAVYCADLHELRYWDVDRDDALIATMQAQGVFVWTEYVEKGVLPPALDPLDPRCRSGKCRFQYICQGEELERKFGDGFTPSSEHDESITDLVRAYRKAKYDQKNINKEIKRLDLELRKTMGDRTEVSCSAGTVTYRPRLGKKPRRELRISKAKK